MAFNVQNMVSRGLKGGVAKTSHFEVLISRPSGLRRGPAIFQEGLDKSAEDLRYRADSVEIPGRNIMTIDQRFSMNGPINKVPYAQTHGDITITFLLSQDLKEKDFFEKWQESMLDTTPQGFGQAFNVKYFDDYKSNLDIRQFDERGRLQNTIRLVDAYPIIMNGIQMAWSDDQIARLSLQFAFRYYEIQKELEQVGKSETPGALEERGFNGRLIELSNLIT